MKKTVLLCAVVGLFAMTAFKENTNTKTNHAAPYYGADSVRIDSTSGFIIAEGMNMVQAHCTGCHSNKVVTQYRATRENWIDRIRWMQKNHNLWKLGKAEPIILDYLTKNYPPRPIQSNRRTPLNNIQWYRLNNN